MDIDEDDFIAPAAFLAPEPEVIATPTGETLIYRFTVPDDAPDTRMDRWLGGCFKGFSRSDVQAAIEEGLVSQNRQTVSRTTRPRPGATLEIHLRRQQPTVLRPNADISLQVIFEDEHLVAVNKPSGMVTHPGHGTDDSTLVHALLHHCGPGGLSRIGGEERPGIVHRLDKETSGLIIAAKSDEAHLRLATLFQEREMEKTYYACVQSASQLLSGTIDQPIGRHPTHRTKMAVDKNGKSARSIWSQVGTDPRGFASWKVRILTGRTHQIRVHCMFTGHPLLGDNLYGYRWNGKYPKPERVMLHSASLCLDHPISGEPLELVAPVPPDMADYWSRSK